jgi:hypothetical protein
LQCQQLKALGVVAVPDLRHTPIAPIAELVESTTEVLNGFSLDLLAHTSSGEERPSFEAVMAKFATTQYAVLHFLARAILSENGSDVLLGFEKEGGKVDVIRLDRLLASLSATRHLPQLAFLIPPYSDDATAAGALRLLARSLVENAGMLAALAPHASLSKRTVSAFAARFYRGLLTHGVLDQAYGEACAEVSRYPDFVPPALFSRLREYPLFYCEDDPLAMKS